MPVRKLLADPVLGRAAEFTCPLSGARTDNRAPMGGLSENISATDRPAGNRQRSPRSFRGAHLSFADEIQEGHEPRRRQKG